MAINITVDGVTYEGISTISVGGKRLSLSYVSESIPAYAINLDKNSANGKVNETVTLTATMTPSDATETIAWSSSDPTICTVSPSDDGYTCVVNCLSTGTATITAETNISGLTASCTVTVATNIAPIYFATLDTHAGYYVGANGSILADGSGRNGYVIIPYTDGMEISTVHIAGLDFGYLFDGETFTKITGDTTANSVSTIKLTGKSAESVYVNMYTHTPTGTDATRYWYDPDGGTLEE